MSSSLTLKTEVRKQSHVLGALLALCKLGKHQEPLPALALPHPHALEPDGQAVEIALGDAAPLHDPAGADVLIAQVDKRGDDGGREDPLQDVVVVRLHRRRPPIKGQQVDGGEYVDAVQCDGQYQRKVEVAVGERRPAPGRLEVVETLIAGA